MLAKYIFWFGAWWRNPSLLKTYRFLKSSEKWPTKRSVDYQLTECKNLIEFADKYSSFWHEYFRINGFNISKFKTLEDLKKLPPITKSDLLSRNKDIHTKYQFKKKFYSETSGTTGEVLKYWKNEEWDSFNRAAIMRGYSWYGVDIWQRNGYFWGYNIDKSNAYKIKLLDALQNRFRLFSYSEKSITEFALKLKRAKYLHGYSSMIYEVAKKCNKMGLQVNNLKLVKGTSEKIFDSYQHEIDQAFGVKAINEYGSAETGIIGFECPHGNIHVNMQGVIVEHENNEIIVTNLVSRSFPIIRYRLGDYIELIPEYKCICGMHTPIIKNIIGRIGKTVYGIKDIYPSLTFYYIFKNLAINNNLNLNYQVVQNERGKLLFRIEQELTNEQNILLINEIKKYFNKDMFIEIRSRQVLHTMNGKLKDFISTL